MTILTAALALVPVALLAGAAPAGADVVRGPCAGGAHGMRDRADRLCLEANDSTGPWVALHVRTRSGHDAAWASGMVSDGGRLWLERTYQGRVERVSVRTAPRDGASGQTLLSTAEVGDGPGVRVRACADQADGSHRTCTKAN